MRPDAFAAVMATGIVSVAALDHGYRFVSDGMLLVAVVLLPVLTVVTATVWRRRRWHVRELDVCLGLCTFVAACCVLASRLSAHPVAVWVFGAPAVLGWVSLAPVVASALWRNRGPVLRDHAHGGWELASVATSGVALVLVAAQCTWWAVPYWVFALAVYALMTGLVLWRWVHSRTVRRTPDGWVLMGGLAIGTLAGEHLHAGLPPGPFADGVRVATVVTWVLATLWIPALLVLGVRRVDAWPAVFPLGMYSAATYAVARETGWHALVTVSLVFCWIALAAWAATAVSAAVRSAP